MKEMTFDTIRENNLLIYEYIRGSHAYGLNLPPDKNGNEVSDVDTAGVFIEPKEWLFGLGKDYKEQVADERNDTVWYSLRKFMNMLLSSNPTVLESLFIPERCILYEHPIMTELKKHRDEFVTKEAFKPMIAYGISQIRKARSQNKLIVNPITERLKPLDFAYTFYKQGSSKITNWLEYRHLKQNYCGLVCIPNMYNIYGVYYDWGNFFLNENITLDIIKKAFDEWEEMDITDVVFGIKRIEDKDSQEYKDAQIRLDKAQFQNMLNFIQSFYEINGFEQVAEWYEKQVPIGYKGMVGGNDLSNELRLSSVSKGEKPICYISYNKDGYSQHCRMYKEYQDWVKFRNPERFKQTIRNGRNYDCKNCCHSARLIHMGIELAKNGKFNIDRSNIDRDFLLSIRNGIMSYDDMIAYLDERKYEMEEAMATSTLPDAIDVEKVNQILLDIRNKFYVQKSH